MSTPPVATSLAPSYAPRTQWALLVLFLAAIGASLVYKGWNEREALERGERERLVHHARMIGQNLEQNLTIVVRALESVRNAIPEWRKDIGVQVAAERRMKALAAMLPGVRTLDLLDSRGVVMASNRVELVGRNFSEREYFANVRALTDPRGVVLSAPFRTVLNAYGINLALPLWGDRGEFAGAITATLDRDFFATLFESARFAPDVVVALVHDTGAAFVMVPEIATVTGRNLDVEGTVFRRHREARVDESVQTGLAVSTGDERMMALRTIKPAQLYLDHGVIVEVSRPIDAIFAPSWREITEDGAIWWVIAVSTMLVLLWYQRRQREAVRVALQSASEQHRMQHALAQSEERLRRSQDYAEFGSWDWDIASGRMNWAERTYALLGYERGRIEPSYEAYINSVHPDDRARVSAAINTCIRDGRSYHAEFRVKGREGAPRWVLDRGNVARDDKNQPVSMTSIVQDITERKNAEAILRKWADAFRHCAHGIALGNPVTQHVMVCNAAFARMLGRAPEDIENHPIHELYAPQDRTRVRAEIERADARGYASYEAQMCAAHGVLVPVHVNLVSVRDSNGTLMYRVASVEDISERRRAEEQLRAGEERFRSVVNSMDDMVYTLDRDQRHTAVYGSWVERGGLAPSDFIGKTAREISGAQAAAVHEAANVRALAGESVVYEWSAVGAQGECHYQTSLAPLRDAAHLVVGLVGVGRDITARVLAERAAREGEATLRGFFDNAPLLMGIIDLLDDDILHVADNFATERFFNIGSGFSRGKRASELGVTPHVIQMWRSHYLESRRTGVPQRFEYRHGEGDAVRILSVTVAALTSRDSNTRYCYIAEDITLRSRALVERAELQQRLQQAQKMETVGRLTGGVAHDFNNILASILGYTDLILERYADALPEKGREYLAEVEKAGGRARDLVSKMLAFARNKKREQQIISPRQQVIDVMKMLRSVVPATIDMVLDADADVPEINADPVTIHEAITNLVINARDALNGKGHITFSLRRVREARVECSSCHHEVSGEYVEITVSDSGDGIPADALPNIFDPFFTTKGVGRGTGMGLSMVHGVVHEANGHIVVASRLGEGSTFRLLFPVSDATAVERRPEAPVTKDIAGHATGWVMVVDDEESLARMIADWLELRGYRARVFTSSKAAVEAFRAMPHAYSAVITDHTMPDLTGAELTRAVLAIRPALPVILCTGYSESMDAERAQSIGVFRFFNKPVKLSELLSALAEVK